MSIEKPTTSKRLQMRQIPSGETAVMKHKWRDLIFIHWIFDPHEIQSTLPDGLYADTFNGQAYVGITPFFLFDVRPVFLPAVPFISDFLEVNVRTYVYDKNGTPGVWFYSLDANQPVAVKLAQQVNLPYRYADIKALKTESTGEFIFNVKRKNTSDALTSEFRYVKKGNEFFAESETIEFFLLERYLLFTHDPVSKKLSSIRVYHQPYPLFNGELIKWDDNLLKLNGLKTDKLQPDHVTVSSGVDVDVFNIKKVI